MAWLKNRSLLQVRHLGRIRLCPTLVYTATRLAHSESTSEQRRLKLINSFYPSADNLSPSRFADVRDFIKATDQSGSDVKLLAKEAGQLLCNRKAQLEQLPFEERKEEVVKTEAAKILAWILSVDKAQWNVLISRQVSSTLSWYLEVSGQSDLLVELIRLESDRDKDRGRQLKFSDHSSSWGARLLAGYLLAKLYWYRDPHVALAAFETSNKGKRSVLNHASAHMVSTVVRKVFQDSLLPRYESRTFDLYTSLLPLFTPNFKQSRQEAVGLAWLFHPATPDPSPFLELALKEDYRQQWTHNEHLGNRGSGALARYMLRASYILRLQGYEAEGKWLISLIDQGHHPTWFNRYKIAKVDYLPDEKLQALHESSPHFDMIWNQLELEERERLEVQEAKSKPMRPEKPGEKRLRFESGEPFRPSPW